jgi:hypothetical protein
MTEKHNRLSAADRRRQIINVAMELFAKQGFQGTTTRQIAADTQPAAAAPATPATAALATAAPAATKPQDAATSDGSPSSAK